MGTNALPYLLDWMRECQTTGGAITTVKSIVTNLPSVITPASWNEWAKNDQKLYRALGAAFAIGDLGEQAQVAMPELTAMMKANSRGSSDMAVIALAGIGRPAIPVLTEALADPSNPQRLMLIQVFWWVPSLYTNASAATSAVSVLVSAANDKYVFGVLAVRALGRMAEYDRSQADMVIPTLEKCLNSTNRKDMRTTAMSALAVYGREQKSVVPHFVELLGDSDWHVRLVATNILRDMAPWALTNSPSLQKGLEAPLPKR